MSSNKTQSDILRAIEISKTPAKLWSQEESAFMRSMVNELSTLEAYKRGLPHLYGFPWYGWARHIFESKNKEICCTAANQVSKSSTAIRKNIHLATSPNLWREFWPGLRDWQKPGLFWYFLPTKEACTTEFEQKWEKEFLPREDFKSHAQYGWEAEYFKGEIHAVNFNTGVSIQFKTYAQKIKDLQTSSVYHLTCDEELPEVYFPELKARLNATDGYFLTVFTATLGQDFWRKVMEPIDSTEELMKDALKIRVSLYDSQVYDDGTPSPWTDAKIKRAIANCPTEAEIQRRIYGRFVKSEGLMYESFSLENNLASDPINQKNMNIFTGVDPGSGGKSGHPAAMVFIAVNQAHTEGRVFRCWRGDGIPTTSLDILTKYKELKGSLQPVAAKYDFAAKDFFMVSAQSGEAFSPADKGRDRGSAILNTLFKNKMLKIQRGDPELDKLVQELCSLSSTAAKTTAKDDLIDALRYTVMAVPWDFSGIEVPKELKTLNQEDRDESLGKPIDERKEWFLNSKKKNAEGEKVEDELGFWSEMFDT